MKKNIARRFIATLLGSATLCVGLGFALLADQAKPIEVQAETLSGFTIDEGAAVRTVEPNGIRFTTTVDEATKSAVSALKNVTYGTLMIPESKLNGELTLETASVLDVPALRWQNEEKTEYTGVLAGSENADGTFVNLPASYYNRVIVARGYVKGTDTSGNTVVYYSSNTAERSIGYVAMMAYLDGEESSLVTDIVSQTKVEVFMDTQLSTMQSESGKFLVENANALNGQTDVVVKVGGVAVSDTSKYSISYTLGTEGVVEANGATLSAVSTGTTAVTATVTLGDKQYESTNTVTVTDEFVAKSDYSILIPAAASGNEKSAANEFKSFFREATGITLPIVTETGSETTSGKYISVGETTLAKNKVSLGSLTKSTASAVKTVDNTLFVRGVQDKGTLFGVEELLQDLLEYRFYMKDTYSLNTVEGTLALPAFDEGKEYNPDIEFVINDQNAEVLPNYQMQGVYDGAIMLEGSAHNSLLVLPFGTYGESNDDWYAKKKGGVLTTYYTTQSDWDLCYEANGNTTTSYNKMVTEVATKIVTAFGEQSEKTKVFFGIMDQSNWCQCATCASVNNPSESLITFLNDVCDSVGSTLTEKKDPRASTFEIATFAYHPTTPAPTTAPDKHIEIWFGDSWANYVIPLSDTSSAINKEIYTNYQNWLSVIPDENGENVNDMLLWTYYTNTENGFAPYNSFAAMRSNYGIAVDGGVDYILNQTIQARTGWTMLKLYLASELRWNAKPTDTEWNAWLDGYFTTAYGAGSTAMREWFDAWVEYLDSVQSSYIKDGTAEVNGNSIHATDYIVDTEIFNKTTMDEWIGYADRALAALDTSDPNYQIYYNNIILEKLSPEYMLMALHGEKSTYAAEFTYGVETWGITKLKEGDTSWDPSNVTGMTTAATTVNDLFIAKNGTVTLTNENLVTGTYTVTANGTSSSVDVSTAGQLTVTLSDLTEGETYAVMCTNSDSAVSITFANVLITTKDLYAVNMPSESSYYSFSGAKTVEAGADYTFEIKPTDSALVDFIVLVNGERMEGVDNTYTVENVNETLAIEVLHGYIEHVSSVVVGYNSDGSIEIINSNGNRNLAYISGAFLDYMYSLGYTQIQMYTAPDGTNANQACTWSDATNTIVRTPENQTTIVVHTLSETNSNFNFWVQKDGTGAGLDTAGGYLTVTDLKYGFNVPTSKYYTFNGASTFTPGEAYTFTLTETIAGMNDFTVLVNGKEIVASNGVYTVENTAVMDIKVLHGYIEYGDKATVTYNDDGSIKVENALFVSYSESTAPYMAYISAEYIEYMIAQGYTQLNLTAQADGTIVAQVVGNYNGSNVVWISGSDSKSFSIALVEGANTDFIIWGQNASGSGNDIKDLGGYLTVTDLKFTAPVTVSTDSYYTFNGASTVAYGEDYTFTLTETVSGCDDFIVFVNGERVSGVDNTYTVENVSGPLTIEVLHGYIYYVSGVTVAYNGDTITVTNSTSNSDRAYISAAYLDYMYSLGYTNVRAYLAPDGTIANQALMEVNGVNRTRTLSDTSVAELNNLTATNTNLVFWAMKDWSGAGIANQGASMTVTGLTFVKGASVTKITSDTAYYAENGEVTLKNENFLVGESYTVTVNGAAITATVETAGELNVTLTALTIGSANTVVCESANYEITFTNVIGVTKVIRTVEELSYVRVSTADITGYYILGNDIDGTGSAKIAAGQYAGQGFKGTFDGLGHTISNITVGQGGIFRELYGATVRNVNFENVTLSDTQNYVALLAAKSNSGTVIENVSVSYAKIEWNSDAVYDNGLLICRLMQKTTWKNITIDASGLDVDCVFGQEVLYGSGFASGCKFENVLIKAASITKLADSTFGNNKTDATVITEMDGVTVQLTYAVTVPAESDYYTFKGAENATVGEPYTFTVKEKVSGCNDLLVFVNGEKMEEVNMKYTVESAPESMTIEVLHGYFEADETYATSVENREDSIIVTNSVFASDGSSRIHGNAYISAAYIEYMIAQGYTHLNLTVQADGAIAIQVVARYNGSNCIYHTDGTQKSFSIALVEGSNTDFEIWAQNSGGSGNAIKGQGGYITVTGLRFVKKLSSDTLFYAENDGTTTLKNENFLVGDTYTVTANGSSATATVETEGELNVTLTALTVGSANTVACVGEACEITFTNVFGVTKIIRTVEELSYVRYTKGSDGNITPSITGYYILGNDIDGTGSATIAAGPYEWNYGFTGTFDGLDYTISNISVGQGGIFNALYGATVRNVNFENVTLVRSSNYTALLASIANNGTVIENVSASYTDVYKDDTAVIDYGLLISRQMQKTTWKNVTLDASSLAVRSILGSEVLVDESAASKCTFENVLVMVGSVETLGYTAAGNKADSTKITAVNGVVVVYVPTGTRYYSIEFQSALTVGEQCTFVLKEKVAGCDEFIVLVDGEEVTAENGVYTATVANGMTIEVLHGYIEYGDSVTVTYNDDGSIKVENALFGSNADDRAPYAAYISADYINYMIEQGYTSVQFNYTADNAVATQACAGYTSGGTLFAYIIDGSTKAVTCTLSDIKDGILYFWGQNSDGSGNDIKDQGGYVVITGLTFVK